MHEITKKLHMFLGNFHKVNVQTASLSAFIAGSLSLAAALLYFLFGQNGKEKYTDLVNDYLAMDGAYKGVDITAFYLLVTGFFIVFLFSYFILRHKHFQIEPSKLTPGIIIDIVTAVPIIMYFLAGPQMAAVPFIFFVLITASAIIAHRKRLPPSTVKRIVFSYIYIYLTLTGIKALLFFLGLEQISAYSKAIDSTAVLCWVAVTLLISKLSDAVWRKLNLLQLFIPCNLLGIINTRYVYHGQSVSLDYYNIFRNMITILWIIFEIITLLLIVKQTRKKQAAGLLPMTVASVLAILLWNTGYNLLINTDTFHMGETAIVYNQTVHFNQVWETDFSSIMQGLGLILSGINHFIFSGRFSMYVQSQNLLLICIAIMIGFILCRYAKDNVWFFLYLTFIPIFMMDRTYLVALTFFVLINKRLLELPYVWTYTYVLLCIVNVFYQPTYGGAVCASLLIPLFYIWAQEIKKPGQGLIRFLGRKRNLAFLGSLLLIGVCCIPLLKNALTFLIDNGQATAAANGITILQSFKYFKTPVSFTGNDSADFIVMYFIRYALGPFILMCLFYYFIVYKDRVDESVKRQMLILSVSGILSYFLMTNAALNRIDGGLSRIGSINCMYSALLLLLIILVWKHISNKSAVCLISGGMCFCALYANGFSLFTVNEKVCASVLIPEDAVYLTEEEHGLENLGNIFTDNMAYIYEAKILNELCGKLLTEDQTYYDCLDKSIYYNFTNKPVPGYHVAQYTIGGNSRLQKKAISNLEKRDVPLIFVRGDFQSYISRRSYLVYRYIMQLDYHLIEYKGLHFLVDNELNLEPIQSEISEMSWNWLLESDSWREYANKPEPKKFSENKYDRLDQAVTKKHDILIVKFNNAETINGQLTVSTEAGQISNTVSLDPGKDLVIPSYLLDIQDIVLSENLVGYLDEIFSLSITPKYRDAFREDVNGILREMEMCKLNEDFQNISIGYAAEEWGTNLQNMRDRVSFTTQLSQNSLSKENPNTVLFDVPDGTEGENAEFLYLELTMDTPGKCAATVIVQGEDRNGNEFSQSLDIAMKDQNSAVLVSIGSSPNVLLAESIKNIRVNFTAGGINVVKAELYKTSEN